MINTSLYAQVCAWDNLLLAYRKASKGKRSKVPVASFEYHLEDNLIALQTELQSKTYKPGPYQSFVVYETKRRLISAAPFVVIVSILIMLLSIRWFIWWMQQGSLLFEFYQKEMQEKNWDIFARWQRWQVLLILVWVAGLIPILALQRWSLLTLFFVTVPIDLIFRGRVIVELQCMLSINPFRPMSLITGEPAVRRGRIIQIIGWLLIVPCGLAALTSAFWPF